jgi:hypothetical protein
MILFPKPLPRSSGATAIAATRLVHPRRAMRMTATGLFSRIYT